MAENMQSILSLKVRRAIDVWLKRYPPEQKRSGVLQALRYAQEDNKGYLSTQLMDAVADYLELPKIAVYEVASFYNMYNLKPVGRHVINVCTNISCMLNGAEETLEHLKKKLKIELNETTADGRFTLREVECLAACIHAPAVCVGKKYYEKVDSNKADALIEELENN